MLQNRSDITTQIFCKSNRSTLMRRGEESIGFCCWNLEVKISRIMKKRGNLGGNFG